MYKMMGSDGCVDLCAATGASTHHHIGKSFVVSTTRRHKQIIMGSIHIGGDEKILHICTSREHTQTHSRHSFSTLIVSAVLDFLDYSLEIRPRERIKVIRRKFTRPGVEELHRLRAVIRLVTHICDNALREFVEQRMQECRVTKGHALDFGIRSAGAALDDVTRQSEWRSDKAQNRRVVTNLHTYTQTRERERERETYIYVYIFE